MKNLTTQEQKLMNAINDHMDANHCESDYLTHFIVDTDSIKGLCDKETIAQIKEENKTVRAIVTSLQNKGYVKVSKDENGQKVIARLHR